MIHRETHVSDLKFPLHTEEKLEIIEYYYKVWFKIVNKRQKAYIIDTHAGTGFNQIRGSSEKRPGSAILAVDLFKEKGEPEFIIYLNQKNKEQFDLLNNNIKDHIKEQNLSAKIDKDIFFFQDDWKNVINGILKKTRDGIRFYFIDPTGIKTVPWIEVGKVLMEGIDEFNDKESGFEVLINWAWHKIVRDLGIYYKAKAAGKLNDADFLLINLNNFFGPVAWKVIANKYPNNIFDNNREDLIENLSNDLLMEYSKNIFTYFNFISIHPVHNRKKSKTSNLRYKGKVKYFLFFATNYQEAYEIIDYKFNESRGVEIFREGPDPQQSILKWCRKQDNNKPIIQQEKYLTIDEKIELLEKELNIELYDNNKVIIKQLYRRKNYDYGIFEIYLYREFGIKEPKSSLGFLKGFNIIDVKKKRTKKTGKVFKFWYLTHPLLVDRSQYLFLNGIKHKFSNNNYEKC